MQPKSEQFDSLTAEMQEMFFRDPDDLLTKLAQVIRDLHALPEASFVGEGLSLLHNLKGSAQAVGLASLGKIFHLFEEVMGRIDRGSISAIKDAALPLLDIIESLEALFTLQQQNESDFTVSKSQELLQAITQTLQELSTKPAVLTAEPQAVTPSASSWGLFTDEEASAPISTPAPTGIKPAVDTLDEPSHRNADSSTSYLKVGPEELDMLIFRIHGQMHAVPVMHVREVIGGRPMYAMPFSVQGVMGLIALRGSVLPVLRFTSTKKTGLSSPGFRSCIIICEMDNKAFGLVVDEASRVMQIKQTDIMNIVSQDHRMVPVFVKSVVEIEGETSLILDLDAITKNVSLSIPETLASAEELAA